MNIMILSPGRRVEIVDYFIKALDGQGNVITLDMNPYAPGLYSGDKYYCMEKDFENIKGYVSDIIDICIKEEIKAIITLIDPELPMLSEYRKSFEGKGIIPIISDSDLATVTLDKYAFYDRFKDRLPVVRTFKDKDTVYEEMKNGRLFFPLFVKPRRGSGSEGLRSIVNMDEFGACHETDIVYQPFSKKKEYGCDVYFDMISGSIKRVFIKEKLNMRSGETDKSISVHNEEILSVIRKLEGIGFKGPIDVDVFEDFEGRYLINEINPRFGGGYPHAYHCGQNFMDCIVQNLAGSEIAENIGNYEDGIVMMKYNGLFFKKEKEIAKRGENRNGTFNR